MDPDAEFRHTLTGIFFVSGLGAFSEILWGMGSGMTLADQLGMIPTVLALIGAIQIGVDAIERS
jgi:hypothetical protein